MRIQVRNIHMYDVNNYNYKRIRKRNNITKSCVFQVLTRKPAHTIVELRWTLFKKPAMKK